MAEQRDAKTTVKKTKTKEVKWHEGTGRRKTSVARVRLSLGKDGLIINSKSVAEYFFGPVMQKEYEKPFVVVNRLGTFNGSILVAGGGPHSQLGSVVLGVANALVSYDPTFRAPLSVAGLLTRDSRMKESRKFGLAGKARKHKQSPKR